MDTISGKIIYSYDLNQKVSEFLKIKKDTLKINYVMMLNNEIFIFLKNSYVLNLGINGNLKEIRKFPSSISSLPIIIDDKILYLNNKGKVLFIN